MARPSNRADRYWLVGHSMVQVPPAIGPWMVKGAWSPSHFAPREERASRSGLTGRFCICSSPVMRNRNGRVASMAVARYRVVPLFMQSSASPSRRARWVLSTVRVEPSLLKESFAPRLSARWKHALVSLLCRTPAMVLTPWAKVAIRVARIVWLFDPGILMVPR